MKSKSKESDKRVDAVLRATQILNCFETFPKLFLSRELLMKMGYIENNIQDK